MEQQSDGKDNAAVRLGNRLRRARLARNMTQSEVAQRQFSVSYISAVERGQIRPSLGALERLALRLQIPLSELLRDDDSAPMTIAPLAADRVDSRTESPELERRLTEARVMAYQGKTAEALAVLSRASSQAISQRDQALLHWHYAHCHLADGNADEARRELMEAIPLAEKAADVDLRERLRNELGTAYSLSGKHQLALEQFQECLAACEDNTMSDPSFLLNVLYNIGEQQWHLGEFAAAVEYLSRAERVANEVLDLQRVGTDYFNLSAGYQAQGDTRRARAYAVRSLNAFEAAANQRLAARTYSRLGRAYQRTGNDEAATVHLRMALDMAEQQHDAIGVVEAQRGLSGIFLNQGQIEDAERAVERASELAAALNDPVQEGETLLARARVREAHNNADAASRDFEDAIAVLRNADAAQSLSDAYAQYSSFLERRGEGARALEVLKQAWSVRERGTVAP